MQTTITKLTTWAQVNDSAFRHYKPDGNVSLTLAVANNTLINKLIVNQDRIMDRVRVGKRKVYLTL